MSGEDPNQPGLPAARHVLLVLLACLLVYWPRLGATGFSNTEGHRVIPGWQMLEHGEWLLPRLFGQVYLRKPPGMSWAVAAAGAVLGESEFSARAVSALAATAGALVCLVFGSRWFGRKAGVAAGLAAALTPLFWPPGRSAEIETLNNFATLAAVLLILDVALPPEGRRRGRALGLAALGGLAIGAAALAKGPAGFAAIGSAVLVGAFASRRLATQPRPVWMSLLVGAAIIGTAAALLARAVHTSGEFPVTQGVSEFLWDSSQWTLRGVIKVAAIPLLATAAALPASLALLFPWGRDARAEASDPGAARWLAIARAVGLTCLLSLVVLVVLGVDNARYAMPSVSFVPVLAAYVARGWAGGFGPIRRRIAAWMALGHPAAWPVVLLVGGAVYIAVVEPRLRANSGRDAGLTLAASLRDGALIWANGMIEARPEVLLYAQHEAAARGHKVTFVWTPGMDSYLSLPRPGGLLLLRTDAGSNEAAAYKKAGFMDRLRPIARGSVHKYTFTLYEMVRPQSQPAPAP